MGVEPVIEIREIPEAEWPEDARAELIPGSRAFGAFEDGELAAVLGVFTAVLLDPLWVAPNHRKRQSNGRILLNLWTTVKTLLRDHGVRIVMAIENEETPQMIRRVKRWCGAREMVRRRLFLIPTGER